MILLTYLVARLPPSTNNLRPAGVVVIDSNMTNSEVENLKYMPASNQPDPIIPSNNT